MNQDARPVTVWDLPTRIFHWSLVFFVVVSIASGEDEGLALTLHTWAGYAVCLLLLFRAGWGVIGSRRSRFHDFVRGWPAVAAHGRSLLRLRPERHVGHNPIGGWMIVILLVSLTIAAGSGLFTGEDGRGGPFLQYAPWLGDEGLDDLHEFFGHLIILLAVVHIGGVMVDWLLTRDNLVRAMITGTKWLDPETALIEPPPVGLWRAVLLSLIVAAAGAYLFF